MAHFVRSLAHFTPSNWLARKWQLTVRAFNCMSVQLALLMSLYTVESSKEISSKLSSMNEFKSLNRERADYGNEVCDSQIWQE